MLNIIEVANGRNRGNIYKMKFQDGSHILVGVNCHGDIYEVIEGVFEDDIVDMYSLETIVASKFELLYKEV